MKFLVSTLVAAQLLTAQAPMLQVNAEVPQEQQEQETAKKAPILKAQKVKWYYRTYKGREQMRLWSLTEEKWITGWIDCE